MSPEKLYGLSIVPNYPGDKLTGVGCFSKRVCFLATHLFQNVLGDSLNNLQD